MVKVSDALMLALGKATANVAMAATGTTALGGRQSVVGKMLDTFNKISKQGAEREKVTKERAENLKLAPSHLEAIEYQKEIKEALEELKELQERESRIKDPMSSAALKKFYDIAKESNKTLLDATEISADAVDRHTAAVQEQPKKMSEEVKKSGFASKFLTAVKGGLREVVTGERRKGAVQAVLGATGLGQLEEVFGISEKLEVFLQKRKQEKEEKKKAEELQAKKAELMELPLEEYKGLLKSKEEWEKKVEAHKERVELGIEGFKDVEIWEKEQKRKSEQKRIAEGKGTKGLLTEGEIPKGLLPEITSGLTEGIKEGIKEEFEAFGGHLEQVVEHTEGTRGEVRDLKTILTGSAEEQKKVTEQIAENTAKTKEAIEESRKDKDKLSLKDMVGMATGAGKGLTDLIPGLPKGGGKAGGKLGSKIGGKLVKSFLKKLPVVGAVVGAGLAIERLSKGDYTGAALEAGEGVASILPGPGTAISAGLGGIGLARDVYKEGLETPPTATEDIKAKREGEVPPPISPKAEDIKDDRERKDVPVTQQKMSAQERILAQRGAIVEAQIKAAGLKPATTESQMVKPVETPVPHETAQQRLMRERGEKTRGITPTPSPDVMQVPGPMALGGKPAEVQKPMILPSPPQPSQQQASIQRATYVDDLNIAITNQLMFQ